MTLKECYAAMGGNYEDAIGRLRSERLVQKFVLKFLADPSYDLLMSSLQLLRYVLIFLGRNGGRGGPPPRPGGGEARIQFWP